MSINFYNTLTNQIDEFVPIVDGKVSLYTCGPTVYNFLHVGNWAAYLYWDILVRVLAANNLEVTRVMNVTDVGHLNSDSDTGVDKLEIGAKREGKTAWEIAKFYTEDFVSGMKRLGLIEPQHLARATDFISQQLDLVGKLKEKGFTYQTSDGIYFDTSKFPTYADLAHLDLKGQKAGARVEFNPEKRNHSDFALWKFTPHNEQRDMEWPTPEDLLDGSAPKGDQDKAVMGFPGWHLECSAISMYFLGSTLDIHTGGIDHLPIHHTNEIAQSEAATGVKFSNYWLHNNFLKVNGTKISKSLNNGYTLDDIEAKGYTMQDFRMFVLQGHYRNEGNFTFDNLESAKNRLKNWQNIASLRHQIHSNLQVDARLQLLSSPAAIIEAVSNDLDTPEALKIIDNVFAQIASSDLAQIDHNQLVQILETIDSVLGLQLISSTPDISDEIKQVLIERKNSRANKDWAKSDQLRDQLAAGGIIVRDSAAGSIWERA